MQHEGREIDGMGNSSSHLMNGGREIEGMGNSSCHLIHGDREIDGVGNSSSHLIHGVPHKKYNPRPPCFSKGTYYLVVHST